MITIEEAQTLVEQLDAMGAQLQEMRLKIEDCMLSRMDPDGMHACMIIRAVCEVHGIPRRLLMTKTREARIVAARHTAMHLMRYRGGLSCSQAGRFLGCDHSNVIHGSARVADLLEVDPNFITQYMDCERKYDDLLGSTTQEEA